MGISISDIANDTPITVEEGYRLTEFYVSYYWNTGKFYSLKDTMEEGDVLGEIYMKLFSHNHFAKYDSSVSTKKYFVCRAVFTSMIDLLRKQRITYSLDSTNEETGLSLADLVVDETQRVAEQATGTSIRDSIIAQIPCETNSKVVGILPNGQEVTLNFRVLAELLEQGYTVKDIAGFYKNPKTGGKLSEASISKYIRDLREYVLDNIVIA